MGRVFICGDTGLELMLADTAKMLAELGHLVVRGPKNEIGQIKQYTEAERKEFLSGSDVAVFTARHRCSRELMQNLPCLRGVCYPVIGIETLDVDAASELGIIVGHGAVHANVVGMAEATLMSMMMLLYDVQTHVGLLKNGQWRRAATTATQLHGKTVGLIGFGRIAKEVAARLVPFGVRVVTASPSASAHELPFGVQKVDLPTLLRESDIVSVLTGLTRETRHMLGASELALMKPTAFLVNTGRGEIIDEDALYVHLRDRKIAGAALDTFTVEPLPVDSPLRMLDNVTLTPHCVGHSIEGNSALAPALVENIRRILADELPLHCANPKAVPTWRERLRRLSPQSQTTSPT